MGDEARFESIDLIGIDRLVEVERRARSGFENFAGFSAAEPQQAFFEHDGGLPPLVAAPGIEIVDVNVSGELPLKGEPWAVFKDIGTSGTRIQELGRLTLHCGFAEKASKQTKRAYDMVAVVMSKGRMFFDYAPNGSRAYLSPEGAREFLTEAIGGVALPLAIEPVGDDFRLRHTSNAALAPRSPFDPRGGLNPSGFICELPGSSATGAVELMQQFVEQFASKRFKYSWYASGLEYEGPPPTPERSLQVYASVVDAKLPAVKHEVQAQFRVSSLAAVDAIQSLCGPRDQVFTGFGGFDFGDNNATLRIETTSSGHRLFMTLRFAEGISKVEQVLGLKFRPEK